jgi:hypothetical protein
MKKIILLLAWATIAINSAMAQEYDAHDLGKLKAFLKQPSAVEGKTNGEQLYLTKADMLTLDTNEDWVEKCLRGRSWTETVPKRLRSITWFDWFRKSLAGTLDLSGCQALTHLDCTTNELTALDVSGCASLTYLCCVDNRLTTLDVTGCVALTNLECGVNHLPTLDVTGCTLLTKLDCGHNELPFLDVSGCASLLELRCDANQLTTLDVTGCTSLTELHCANNQLTTLDLIANTLLTYLSCDPGVEIIGSLLTGNLSVSPVSVSVFVNNNTLSVLSPVSESLTLYSPSGSLLFRSSKLPGHATFTIGHLPKGVIIVKGSTGWVRKIFR